MAKKECREYRPPKIKRTHINSPYMFALTTLCVVVYSMFMLYLTYLGIDNLIVRQVSKSEWFVSGEITSLFFLWGLVFILFIIFAFHSYEYWGILRIREDHLELRALGVLRRRLRYDEIKYVGIDFGDVSGMRQFWIYFSRTPIPMKYFHRMTRLKYTKDTFRVQYNRNTYESLLHYLPPKLSRELAKHYSVIRLHKKHIAD